MRIGPQVIMIVLAIAIIVWDIIVNYADMEQYTVSAELFRLSATYPIIPFALGVLAGHVFWPNYYN